MANIRKLNPVQLSIEPKTKLLVLRQNDNEVKLTRNDVNDMKKLRKGLFDLNSFCSSLIPRKRFSMDENGSITISCKDTWEDNTVTLTNHKKLDDLQRVIDFVEGNKPYIAWERDFGRHK